MSVTLYHPALDRTINVERESKAKILERSGWQRVTEAASANYVTNRTFAESDNRYEFVLEKDDTNTEEADA